MIQLTTAELRDKDSLLKYYRDHSDGTLDKLKDQDLKDYKTTASNLNKYVTDLRHSLISHIEQTATSESWSKTNVLEAVLLATYTSYIVMLETRNKVWPYEYMAFSRRIGELWEPFCLLCWDYPVNDQISYIEPPTFKSVKDNLSDKIASTIGDLNVEQGQKDLLKNMYDAVWALVVSGEIKLETDLHFKDESKKYIVDFKSGFSSNEKGNTNRLLMVASIYKTLNDYECLLFVRSQEESNNHYLQTLKNSGLWHVYCGSETYEQIAKFTKFDLMNWIRRNINWEKDFDPEMYSYLKSNNLLQYLEW